MARKIGRLTALAVAKAQKPGLYPDGAGLYLQVTASGAKSWIYRFMLNGRAREMGLGPASLISLQEARTKAAECRRLRYEGIDPIEARRGARSNAKLEAARSITFQAAAQSYI